MPEDFEQQEYFAVAKAIADFDQRLLTVKSWGVTLSLVALGLGFQYRAYGFFLIAFISSLSFWIIEAVGKRHQMRHYLRMREIEVNRYNRAEEGDKPTSSPRMDWSWHRAHSVLMGTSRVEDLKQPSYRQIGSWTSYRRTWTFPYIAFPHALTLVAGLGLFIMGCAHQLSPSFTLGTPVVSAK